MQMDFKKKIFLPLPDLCDKVGPVFFIIKKVRWNDRSMKVEDDLVGGEDKRCHLGYQVLVGH